MKTTTIRVATMEIRTTEGQGVVVARARDAIGRAVQRRKSGPLPGIHDELLLQMVQAAELPEDDLRAVIGLLTGEDAIDTVGEDVTPPSVRPGRAA